VYLIEKMFNREGFNVFSLCGRGVCYLYDHLMSVEHMEVSEVLLCEMFIQK
jgi:hypothetical protein